MRLYHRFSFILQAIIQGGQENMSGARLKAVYLCLYMGFATWRVFYNVYLSEHGYTGKELGVINALIQVSLVAIVPVWGYFADKRGIRPTLRLAILGTALLMLFLGKILTFELLVFYMLLLTVFHHPLGPLTDGLAVQVSKADPSKYHYGNLRLWGSMGWAVASLITGWLFDFTGLGLIFPLTTALFILALLFMGNPFKKPDKIFRPDFRRIKLKELTQNTPLFVFIGVLFAYGVVCSPVNAWLNLYFFELGVPKSMIGIAYTIQSLSELPFFLLGSWLISRFGSTKVILASITIMTVRMFLYGLTSDVTIALLLGTLQGISLPFFLVGVVDFIHRQFPDGRDATAQSLIWGLYFGIGHTAGNFLTGILADEHGMQGVMYIFAWFTVILLVFTWVYFNYISGERRLSQKTFRIK